MSQSERDARCMGQMAAGDAAALAELYDRHSNHLYSLALRIVRDTSDAEEVLQATWMQAWRSASSYDAARGTVGAWLVTIARSRALDRVRSLASRRRAETAAAQESAAAPAPLAPDPAAGHASGSLKRDIELALSSLAPQQRIALELAYYEGLSQSEIAGRLNAPLGTVKSWTRQALLRLRERVSMEDLP